MIARDIHGRFRQARRLRKRASLGYRVELVVPQAVPSCSYHRAAMFLSCDLHAAGLVFLVPVVFSSNARDLRYLSGSLASFAALLVEIRAFGEANIHTLLRTSDVLRFASPPRQTSFIAVRKKYEGSATSCWAALLPVISCRRFRELQVCARSTVRALAVFRV